MRKLFLLTLMGSAEALGIVRAPRAAYKKQTQVSEKCDYFDGVTAAMLLNTLFSGITAKITAARTTILACRAAIIAVGAGTGTVKQRNLADYLMQNEMNTLLAEIQVIGNADIPHAIIIYESIDVIYRTRSKHERDELEVYHGDNSGSLDMQIRTPEGNFSVVFFITQDPTDENNWRMADFNHNSSGFVDGLKPGEYYHIRAKYKSTITGKSDWTEVIKIMCL